MLFLLKVYKTSTKKVQRGYVLWHWRAIWILKKNQFVVSKKTRVWWIFNPNTQKFSKICTLIGPFHAMYITLDLKRYRGVIFHDTEVPRKIWRKTDSWPRKWREKFTKFPPEHLEVSKLRLWKDLFVQRRNGMSWKIKEELYAVTLKNDGKPDEELTCFLKIDMSNLANFDPITQKSQKFAL